MAKPIHVTDRTFDAEVLMSETPVLADFWAEWCGPCKMVAPIMEEIAEEYDGELKIAKLDVDENGETARRYGVKSIPTLILSQMDSRSNGWWAQCQRSNCCRAFVRT